MSATLTDQPLWFFGNLVHVRVSSADTNGLLAVLEFEGPEGDMPPLRVHRLEDETFVMLAGELTLHTPGVSRTLRAGEAMFAPRGVPHTYRVESEWARWLVLLTPASFADFIETAAVPAEIAEIPPADRPLDMPALLAAAEAHGIELLGPPGLLP